MIIQKERDSENEKKRARLRDRKRQYTEDDIGKI